VIVEPVVCVILHCSRCNTPWLDLESESPSLWTGLAEIAETFRKASGSDVGGWRRTPAERYLCEDCHIVERGEVVEKPPLRPVEEAAVLRAQVEYARSVGQVAAYELLPPIPAEAPGWPPMCVPSPAPTSGTAGCWCAGRAAAATTLHPRWCGPACRVGGPGTSSG
jgi:hypothetical protein